MENDLGWWAIPLAIFGGAIRVSTPFLFVSLGELLTERSGRINLGLEGTLVFGAMAGYGVAFMSGSAWIGVGAAAFAGALFGLTHGLMCSLKGVNDIAIGIALMLLGTGLAFYFGKPFIQPIAPDLSAINRSRTTGRRMVTLSINMPSTVMGYCRVIATLVVGAPCPCSAVGIFSFPLNNQLPDTFGKSRFLTKNFREVYQTIMGTREYLNTVLVAKSKR